MTPRRRALVNDQLDSFGIPRVPPAVLQPIAMFAPTCAQVHLEIGPGGGEHLLEQARRFPETGFIAAEPYINGLASILAGVDRNRLGNVRVCGRDAREVTQSLAPASIARVYCLFPDPWPKARHHKRRLVQPAFAQDLARVLKRGCVIRLATDWADYADHILAVFRRTEGFSWTARRARDWQTPWSDHVQTRYEARRLGDIAPVYLEFQRLT